MEERDFWSLLEFRICGEMQGLQDCRRSGLWCDGFIPDQYVLDASPPYIKGRAWIGFGPRRQEKWQFKLTLRSSPARRADIIWSDLLPPEEYTEWLLVDWKKKCLVIKPGEAVSI